jgi:glutamyl/glutaminyl-tRNA synthetase
VADIGRRAGVFDPNKLAWVNRHYLKQAAPARLASLAAPYLRAAGWLTEAGADAGAFLETVVALAAAAVDRLEEVPARLRFLFDFAPARTLLDPDVRAEAVAARGVLDALADDLGTAGPLVDATAFRACAARVRGRVGVKGRALFHPIRLALTGEAAGMELDSAVPAIERGAALPSGSGLSPIPGARARAEAFLAALGEA